mmetsp:Transcript_5717/g.8853  ORF Transcript_5717/g.8853 Transcript_5717/m.8853 type:complete len:94 (+) Transcript_5717:211-492(+)
MALHNSWSLPVQQEYKNFEKQCKLDYEAEVLAEYKRFEMDTKNDLSIDPHPPTTTQKQTQQHDGKSPFDYDDPLRAYEAFLAEARADYLDNKR